MRNSMTIATAKHYLQPANFIGRMVEDCAVGGVGF